MSQPAAAGAGMSPEWRAVALAEALDAERRRGAVVEFQMEGFAVVRYDHGLRNGLHLLLSLLTIGSWLPVWLFLILRRRPVKYSLRVEHAGSVTRQRYRR